MAITLQELLVKVGADISDYTQGIDEAIAKGQQAESALSGIGVGLSAALTVPLAAIGTAAMEAAAQVKEATNAIIVQTGAMGDQLAGLKGSFADVFANVPQSAKEVADAISQINVRLGLSGAPLTQFTTEIAHLAALTGQQLVPTVEATARAFQQWNITDQSAALNQLFAVFQHTGATVTNLAAGLQEYGAKFKTLGLDFQQSASLLGQFEKEGVNASAAMAGLSKAIATIGKSGQAVDFQSIVNYIKGAADASDGLQRALTIFGPKGAAVFQDIQRGAFDLKNLSDASTGAGKSINDLYESIKPLGEAMKEAWHQTQLALAPLGQVINTTLKDAFISLEGVAIPALRSVAQGFADLSPSTQKVVLGIGAIAAAAGPAILAVSKLNSMLIGPALEGVAAFAASVGNVTFAVSNGLTGALTGGETMLLRFGQAGIIAAAAIAAFESVKSLVESFNGLSDALSRNTDWWKTFTEWINHASEGIGEFYGLVTGLTSGIGTALSVPKQALAEVGIALTSVLSPLAGIIAIISHSDTQLKSGLLDNLKQGAMDALGPLLSLASAMQELTALSEFKGGNYKAMNDAVTANLNRIQSANLNMMKPPDWKTTVGGGNTLDNAAKRDAKLNADLLAANVKAAKEFADALEQVGIAGMHMEKLQTAMDLVTKAFQSGRVSVDQYDQAVSTVIDKQIAAADKLAKTTLGGHIDASALAGFKSQLDAIDKAFAKGKIGVGDYEDSLHALQMSLAAASGTSLQNALQHLGIPTQDELSRQARYVADWYQAIVQSGKASLDQLGAAWQKYYADQQKLSGTRLNALAGLGIASQDQLDHALQMDQAYYAQLLKTGTGTYAELDQAQQKLFAAHLAASQGSDAVQYALKALGIPSQASLDQAVALIGKYYATLAASGTAAFSALDQAQQKLFAAQQAALQASDAQSYALKALGIPSQAQLDFAESEIAKYYVAILADAKSTFAQIDQAQQKLFQAQQAALQSIDPAQYAMKVLGIPSTEVINNSLSEMQRYYDAIRTSAASTFAQIDQAQQKLFAAQQAAAQNASASDYALKMLGVPSNAQIDHAAAEVAKYYNAIGTNALKTITQIESAWQKMFAAQQADSAVLSAEKFLGIPSDEEIQHSISMVQSAYKTLEAAYESGQISQFTLEKAQLASIQKIVQEQQQAGIAMSLDQGRQLELLNEQIAKANVNVWGSVHTEVKSVVDALDTGLANAVTNLSDFGKEMAKTLVSIEQQVVTAVFKTLTKPLTEELSKVLTDALAPLGDEIATMLGLVNRATTGISGITTLLNGEPVQVVSEAGKAASSGTAAATATASAAAAPVSSSASSLGSLASISNIAGIVNAGVSIVSGIVQGIQMSRLENLTGEMEVTSRGILNEALNFRKDQWQQHGEILQKMDEAYQMIASGFEDQFQRLGDIWQTLLGGVAPSDSSATGDSRGIKGHGSTNTQPSAMPVYANGQIVNPQIPRGVTPDTTDYMGQYNAAQQALAESSAASAASVASMTASNAASLASVAASSTATTAAINAMATAAAAASQASTSIPGHGRASDTLPVYGGIVTAGTAASDALNAVSNAADSASSAIATSASRVATLGDLLQAVTSTVDASPVVTSLAQTGAPSFTQPFDMFSTPFPVTPDVTDIPPHSSAQAPGGGTWEDGHFYADKNPDPWTAIMASINAQGNWMPPSASGPPMPALATVGNNSKVVNVNITGNTFRSRADMDYLLQMTLNKLA